MNIKNLCILIFLFFSSHSFANYLNESETRSSDQKMTVNIVNYTSNEMTLHSESILWGSWLWHPEKKINILSDTSMKIEGSVFRGYEAIVVYDVKGTDGKDYRLSIEPDSEHLVPDSGRVDYCLASVEPPRICQTTVGGMQVHSSEDSNTNNGKEKVNTIYLKRTDGKLKITDLCTTTSLYEGKDRAVESITSMSETIKPQIYTHDFVLKKRASDARVFKVGHHGEDGALDLLTTAYNLGIPLETCNIIKIPALGEQESLIMMKR